MYFQDVALAYVFLYVSTNILIDHKMYSQYNSLYYSFYAKKMLPIRTFYASIII